MQASAGTRRDRQGHAGTQGGSDATDDVTRTMHVISDAARRIGEIINVNGGMAFQTNILALDAVVKAPAQANKAAALPWWPARCAAWRSAPPARPGRSSS